MDFEVDLRVGDAHDLAEFVGKEYGRLDVLVNNAAICFNDPTLYGKVPHTPFKEQANITVRTNFFGTLALTQQSRDRDGRSSGADDREFCRLPAFDGRGRPAPRAVLAAPEREL